MRPTTAISAAVPVLRWWLGLTALSLGLLYSAGGGAAGLLTAWGLVEALADRSSLTLPFAAFAGGLAAGSISRPAVRLRSAAAIGFVAGVLAYGLGGWVVPTAEYRSLRGAPETVALRFPDGPRTPPILLAEYRRVRANPPAEYSFSTDTPDQVPPNWTLYLLHLDVAAAFFALVSTFLGLLVGGMTSGLSPPRRRRLRWSAGLLNAVGYLAVAIPVSRWVRQSPTNSALIAAWLPVVVGVAVVLVLFAETRRHARASDASSA